MRQLGLCVCVYFEIGNEAEGAENTLKQFVTFLFHFNTFRKGHIYNDV